MKKNNEIIALLRSLIQKIYLYFTINSLVRFAHSIRLFGEIFIYFFHFFPTAGKNFIIFFHRGNNASLFLALLNRGAANNPCYAPAVGFYLPLLNFILPLIENSLISRNFRYDWVVLFIRNPKMASDLL